MNSTSSLSTQLSEFKTAFKQRAAPERVTMMEAATAALRASGIEERALKVGAQAPDLSLPDASGKSVRLQDLWQRGPLVLLFYRGGWCPYCNLELRAWQQKLGTLKQLDASLVAISPQLPDGSLSTAQKNELAYPVLSDSDLVAANAFGVSFTLPPELVALYSQVGNDLPVINGNGQWVLPVPASYVIDRQGRIAFAHVEADYRERAEPSEMLETVAALRSDTLRRATPSSSQRTV
jgi:peroxiredoxin